VRLPWYGKQEGKGLPPLKNIPVTSAAKGIADPKTAFPLGKRKKALARQPRFTRPRGKEEGKGLPIRRQGALKEVDNNTTCKPITGGEGKGGGKEKVIHADHKVSSYKKNI